MQATRQLFWSISLPMAGGVRGRALILAWGFVLSPWVGVGALALLVADAVHVGRTYHGLADSHSTAGRVVGWWMGYGGRGTNCRSPQVEAFARTPRGDIVRYDRARQIRDYAPNPPQGIVAMAIYDRITQTGGFWAPTWITDVQHFSIYDPRDHAP